MSPAPPSGLLQHRSVRYDNDEELIGRLLPSLVDDVEAGLAVLVSLSDPQWSMLSAGLGERAGSVTYLPSSSRYTRPVRTMATLSEFVTDALATGAPGVRAVGEVPFPGGAGDAEWLRYEGALNDVFADVPLHCSCISRDSSLAPATRDLVAALHASTEDVGGAVRPSDADPREVCRHLPPSVRAPSTAPDVALSGATTVAVRRAAADLVGADLEPSRLGELQLVLTELAVNAGRHGGGGGGVRMWALPDGIYVSVTDGGPGIGDPFAGLRPPARDPGGRGLWIVNHLCDALAYEHQEGGSTVTARFPWSPPA